MTVPGDHETREALENLVALDTAAIRYRKAYRKAEAARAPLLKKLEKSDWPASKELDQELMKLNRDIVKLQGDMLNRTRAYPKRGQWRRLKALQAKVEPLKER